MILPETAEVGSAVAPAGLMAQIVAQEQAAGRQVRDTRGQSLGYDAVSQSSDGQDVRFLVARDLDDKGRVWLTATEWAQFQHLQKDIYLYTGVRGEAQVRALRSDERPWRAQVHERHRRVSIDIAPDQA